MVVAIVRNVNDGWLIDLDFWHLEIKSISNYGLIIFDFGLKILIWVVFVIRFCLCLGKGE